MKAILTGHSRGIGHAVAKHLLLRGFSVLALSRHGNPVLAEQYPVQLTEVALDLSDSQAVSQWLAEGDLQRFVRDAAKLFLINNAGMLGPVAPLGLQEAGALTRAVNLNVTSPFLLADAVVRDTSNEVRIAHISSGAARTAYAGWSIYGATKSAVDHHARSVQKDASDRVRIASIAPGVVDTEMQTTLRGMADENFPLRDQFVALKAEGKLSSPEFVAEKLVDYLLSDHFGHEPVVDLRD